VPNCGGGTNVSYFDNPPLVVDVVDVVVVVDELEPKE
jgi:hypothetical protein